MPKASGQMSNVKCQMLGFSLLELIIYIGVAAIIALSIANMFLSLLRGQSKNEAQGEVNSNIRFAIEKISQDLFSASDVSVPATAGATSTSLAITASDAPVSYCSVSGVIYRKSGAGACDASAEPITASTVNADSIIFTRLENTNAVLNKVSVSIQVDIILSYNSTAPDLQHTEEKKTTVSLP